MSPDLAKGQRVSIANIALAGLTYRLVILPDTPAACGDSGPARGAARRMGRDCPSGAGRRSFRYSSKIDISPYLD